LQEAGIVLHLARSGRLILKAGSQVRDGSILVDGEGRKTCKVIETIGPVASPYLSTQPLTERIERVLGQKLFLSDLSEYSETRSRRFSQNKKKFSKRDSRTRR
jgi:rRNA processing protein Gar1